MNKTIYTAIALLLVAIASIVPWADAQQKPNPVIIWCQDTSGNYAPCLAGNSIDYDSGAGTVNQGTVGIVLPASGGPVAGGTSTNPIRIDPTATTPQPASQSGTWTVQPGNTANTTAWLFKLDQTSTNNDVDIASSLPAGSNTIGNVNLAQYTPASGRLPVDGSGVTQPVSMATNQPVGTVAHDGADSGNPLKIGMKATNSISGKTMVASDDRTDTFAGLDGVPIVRLHSNLEDRVSNVVGVTDGSSTSLVAAQGAGIRFCATTLVVSNSSATNVTVDIRDGTAGSVLMTIPAAANMGGAVIPLPIPLCTSANTAMAQDPSAAATTVTVSAIGFKTKL